MGGPSPDHWVHSSVVRAADCRSAGPWFKSGCALRARTRVRLQMAANSPSLSALKMCTPVQQHRQPLTSKQPYAAKV